MNPYHIVGIIAFSTLIYASLVTGLVWLGMSLFYSMICIYAAALWVMLSMQHRAKQECVSRDRRFRAAEISTFGARYSGFSDLSYFNEVGYSEPVASSGNTNSSFAKESIGEEMESANVQSLNLVQKQDSSEASATTGSKANDCVKSSANCEEFHISDVREYVEHLRRLRRVQRRSLRRSSLRSASRVRAGFKSTAGLQDQVSHQSSKS